MYACKEQQRTAGPFTLDLMEQLDEKKKENVIKAPAVDFFVFLQVILSILYVLCVHVCGRGKGGLQ